MKKILSILGTIGLTATSITTLISCEKPNNNENSGGNKPKPTPEPEPPPKNSNWKILNGTFNNEFNTKNNKWYIMSARKPKTTDGWRIIKFQNNDIDKPFGNVWNNGVALDGEWYSVAELYRWDEVLQPIILPLIDAKTGKIIDWNEQKD